VKFIPPLMIVVSFVSILFAATQEKFVVTERQTPKEVKAVVSTPTHITVFEDRLAELKPVAAPAATSKRVQWLLFTAQSRCAPCVTLDNALTTRLVPKGWEYSASGDPHFRKIDADTNSALVRQWRVTQVPTLILLVDGAEVDRMVGVTDVDLLGNKYLEQSAKHPQPVMQPVFESITVAEVEGRAFISAMFDEIGTRGQDSIIKLGRAELVLPAEQTMMLRVSPSRMALTFAGRRPRLRYDIGVLRLGQEVSGVILERNRIVLQLPGFPDLQIVVR
jgi:thiol-disulfide isomerase/thioredoxin